MVVGLNELYAALFLFKWPASEFQCISTCRFSLNHDEEGRGIGKLCPGCLYLLTHMFILF